MMEEVKKVPFASRSVANVMSHLTQLEIVEEEI